jgi:hypothetical protein
MRYLSTLAVLAALAAGCKQATLCSALGACGGGAPIGIKPGTDGNWILAPGHGSCAETLYIQASDPRLQAGTLPESGTAYPEPAVYDWCILLVAGPGGSTSNLVNAPRLYQENAAYGFVTLKFQPDGHFSSGITHTGTFLLDLPAYCVSAFGAAMGQVDPTDPTSPVVDVCKRLEPPIYSAEISTGAYKNLQCDPNTAELRAQLGLDGAADPGGCLCRYDLNATGGPAGTYELLDASTIRDFPDAVYSNYPQESTYCLHGDELQLTGADGSYLFDQKGLRTLDLVRGCADDTECASGHCDLTNLIAANGICK